LALGRGIRQRCNHRENNVGHLIVELDGAGDLARENLLDQLRAKPDRRRLADRWATAFFPANMQTVRLDAVDYRLR
jgi:hypothetical protein